jgi:hypothetical protein
MLTENHSTEAISAGATARKRRDGRERSARSSRDFRARRRWASAGVKLRAAVDVIFSFTRMGWQRHRSRWEAPTLTTVQRYLMRGLTRLFWRRPILRCGCTCVKNPGEFLWPTMVLG